MEVRPLRVLALEVFRSVNKLNPVYMQVLFGKNLNFKRYKDDLKVCIRNFGTFGHKSERVLGSRIWNMLLAELKRETSYGKFKTQINDWFGPNCNSSAWCLTVQLHSKKPELRFGAGSNSPRGVSELRDGEDL